MEHTNEEGTEFRSEKVRRIRESVRSIQNNREMGVRYMQAWEEKILDRQEGREEGLAEGKEIGIAEGMAKGRAEGRAEGLAEGKEIGLAEGIAEGLAEGKEQQLILLIERKLEKGKTVEEIADALEETPERIQSLIDKISSGWQAAE